MQNFLKVSKVASDFGSMTRATRRVGEYTFMWDGTDANNSLVSAGSYGLCVEVGFEHAGHQFQQGCRSHGARRQIQRHNSRHKFSGTPAR